ncbi:CocE/NonD family hydrolase [Agathobaculum sp.]|uniref:CocE/NonD family hydrolase n=1 Tax=Agathobaculum sp. TaxID=2048138 RepID=UPI003AB5508A
MKKRAASLALVLSMILSFTCQAGAVDANSGDDGQQVSTYAALEASAQSGGLTKLGAVKYILLDCGMKETQFPSGDSDYIAMAKSVGIADDKFDGSAACSLEELHTMATSTAAVNLRNAVKNGTPLFVDGVAQPIFPYTSGVPTEDGYSNDNSDIIRYSVYVETNYDTDGDGKLDLVKALVQLPRAAAEGKYKAAAIYDARPYITGCTDNGDDRKFTYKKDDLGYDLNSLYAQPNARQAEGEAGTMETAAKAKADEWYYVSPYESGSWGDFYDYEDLDWYDYFLVRGYAVVEVGGLGTRGSEGLETCGADVETDAFKCVVEWLAKDSTRTAYTDKENNIQIKADWSNGNVAMTGRSYGGTTDFAVASTGVANLKTIVPVAGIASWYEYTNSQGISTGSNPAYSDNLGFYCAGRYIDEDDWNSMKDVYQKYLNRIYNDQMTLNGDYGTHWATRDYTAGDNGKQIDEAKNIQYSNFSCPALIVHGLNDDNVRTKQFQLMYDAFKNANQDVKLLLHQGAHITPDYDSHKTSLLIGDETYNGILNKWFSHYLYDQNNGAEKMATVTVQSNIVDGGWSTSDTWPTSDAVNANELTLTNNATGTTTINSNMTGISSWRDAFTTASTSASAMYTYDVKDDTVIKGTVKVNIKATPIQHPDKQAVEAADFEAVEAAPRGVDHEEIMNPDNQVADEEEYDAEDEYGIAVMRAGSNSRDALMMSAMLVDVSDKAFQSYTTSVTEDKTGAVNWVGSGAEDYDVINFIPTTSTYKIIARGWIDLANPGAGFSSASAANEVRLEDGKYRNYTVYLQPNYYTVKAGHKLALVVYTYEPGKASYSENYGITIDNAALSAVIPVENGACKAKMSAVAEQCYVSAEAAEDDDYETHGKVTGLERSMVAAGTEVTLTATADSGYDFSGWTVNGEAVEGGATKTFTINGNTTITANFTVYHSSSGGGSSSGSSTTVSASKSDNGSVSIDKTSASKGSTVTVTVKAKDGYKLDKLTITDAKGNTVDVTDKGNGKFSFVMPEGKVTVTPTFVADNGSQTESKSFSDVKTGDWYADAVKYVSDKGLMSGTGSDKFAPSATTTRAMLMTVLARYAGEDTTGGATWYEKGMEWAKAKGVSDGTNPNANITREQLVTMMYRYVGSPKADGKLDSFSDAASVSTYAADAMQWAVANGIVNGSNGKLNPQNNATRAEVAAILMRFCEMSK